MAAHPTGAAAAGSAWRALGRPSSGDQRDLVEAHPPVCPGATCPSGTAAGLRTGPGIGCLATSSSTLMRSGRSTGTSSSTPRSCAPTSMRPAPTGDGERGVGPVPRRSARTLPRGTDHQGPSGRRWARPAAEHRAHRRAAARVHPAAGGAGRHPGAPTGWGWPATQTTWLGDRGSWLQLSVVSGVAAPAWDRPHHPATVRSTPSTTPQRCSWRPSARIRPGPLPAAQPGRTLRCPAQAPSRHCHPI